MVDICFFNRRNSADKIVTDGVVQGNTEDSAKTKTYCTLFNTFTVLKSIYCKIANPKSQNYTHTLFTYYSTIELNEATAQERHQNDEPPS